MLKGVLSKMDSVKFDARISLGHIITLSSFVFAVAIAYTNLQKTDELIKKDIAEIRKVADQNRVIVNKIDVIETNVSYIKESLDKIENKLDEREG